MLIPNMSRQHFQFIAEIIAAMPDHAPTLRAQKDSTARTFADALEATNSRFDREKFLAACTKGA